MFRLVHIYYVYTIFLLKAGNICAHFRDCLFDLCAENGNEELRCASYEAYATACQNEGITLGSWRQQLSCGKICVINVNVNIFNTFLKWKLFWMLIVNDH